MVSAAVGLVALGALPAINSLWLSALGVDYLEAYLESGFAIVLFFGIVAIAIDLDKDPTLIATHPFAYLGGTFQLLSLVYGGLANILREPLPERALVDSGLGFLRNRYRLRTLDLLLTLLFGLVFFAATMAWAVLIAPLQYWVNLVCGAPAREALASSRTLWVRSTPQRVELLFGPKDPADWGEPELKTAHERGEVTEVGFSQKPVSFTSAIAAAALFGVAQLA